MHVSLICNRSIKQGSSPDFAVIPRTLIILSITALLCFNNIPKLLAIIILSHLLIFLYLSSLSLPCVTSFYNTNSSLLLDICELHSSKIRSLSLPIRLSILHLPLSILLNCSARRHSSEHVIFRALKKSTLQKPHCISK